MGSREGGIHCSPEGLITQDNMQLNKLIKSKAVLCLIYLVISDVRVCSCHFPSAVILELGVQISLIVKIKLAIPFISDVDRLKTEKVVLNVDRYISITQDQYVSD